MKELSIEEKAKAYDKVIERAGIYYSTTDSVADAELIEFIFPELKESEDEKIRKALIEGFKVMKDGSYGECTFSNYNIPVKAIIAWLEKQGEQKHIIVPKFREGDIIKLKDTGEIFEVSKIEVYDADEIYYYLTNGGCVCENVDNFERVEQKPVESNKEFEDFVRWFVKQRTDDYTLIPSDEDIHKWAVMILKHAKKCINEQKSVWSKEDIKTMCQIFRIVKDSGCSNRCYNRIAKFLNNITQNPKNHWKPSDQELAAILTVIGDEKQKGSDVVKELRNIYQQLKKLREE